MKFKTIFILFNIIIAISFLFIFFMPVFILGSAYGLSFWGKNWPLALFFVGILAVFNAFFISNWKVFTLIEAENWEELSKILSIRLFEKKQFSRRNVRLFVNASLLRSDSEAIKRLENTLQAEKPALLCREATLFGTAWLLRNDPAGAEQFLTPWLDNKNVDNRDWLNFYYAFSLILQKRALEATSRLEALLNKPDRVLALLAAYLYGSLCVIAAPEVDREHMRLKAEARRQDLAKAFTPERWSRETERAKGEVHVVVLSKLIDEAGTWMFKAAKTEAAG
ncbi:MAG: hypothetical protein KKI09_07255 [Spirochaetes bacterium]|nr:hypothetical protein [Spirochaetota bacterium]MBU0955208.1 hypothetical protein [Spirochaetota bacterium]